MKYIEILDRDQSTEELKQYRRRGSLIFRKLAEYIPVMIITNISLLLINTVDRIVAGNFIGTEAMNSISIFYPALLFTSVFSGPLASGIATHVSNIIGTNNVDELAHTKTIALRLTILTSVIISIVQIPLILGIIWSYNLSDGLSDMVWQYAIGCMICTPLGIISTVGTYQLQIAGRMKVIMVLTIVEGVSNLTFDLLFVSVFDMGVAGTGYGTACANLLRAALTIVYIQKKTDFLKGDGKHVSVKEYRTVFSLGLPDASYMLMLAFQNYFVLHIILRSFGEGGGVIYGLCGFCLNLVNVLLYGIQGGIRPLMGLFIGAGDRQGQRELMHQGMLNVLIYAGTASLAISIFPQFFYHIHGVQDIPEGGIISIRIYAIAFVLRGFDHVLRLYLTNQQDIRFTTALTILGNATLPLFAFLIYYFGAPGPYVFLSYLITELIIFGLSVYRYFYFVKKNKAEEINDVVLYVTVKQNEAVAFAQFMREFAARYDIDNRTSLRVALCIEDMIAFIKRSSDFLLIPDLIPSVDIIVRFTAKDKATIVTLDDGAFIALDSDDEKQELLSSTYGLVKKVASSVEYQYVLNMNYTKLTIE